jgi:DNA-binding MarR family transcriptional regulator
MPSRVPEPHLTAWRSLLNAHAAVTEQAERALREAGLPPLAWYDVLWALRRAPERKLRMGELADNVTLSRGGLTKLVDRLEAAGLLRREASPSDRRGYYAALTEEGERMLRRMWPVYARVLQESFVAALSERDAELLAQALGGVSTRAISVIR